MNVQIIKLNKKGEILAGKYFLFDKFDSDKFDVLSTYVDKHYKRITPAFVFCLDLEKQEAIQVLRNLVNGQAQPLYCVSNGVYYFRSGNLVFFVDEEE